MALNSTIMNRYKSLPSELGISTHNATRERVPNSILPNYNKRNVKTMKYEV